MNNRKKLSWPDLWQAHLMHKDGAGRWYPVTGTPAAEYIAKGGYRAPSRAWPDSYARAILTQKFAKWLSENHPTDARKFGLIDSEVA